jgi:hypothetical protein
MKRPKGHKMPWRLIVMRGWSSHVNRESAARLPDNSNPAAFAEYADEPTARTAFASAVRNERTRE